MFAVVLSQTEVHCLKCGCASGELRVLEHMAGWSFPSLKSLLKVGLMLTLQLWPQGAVGKDTARPSAQLLCRKGGGQQCLTTEGVQVGVGFRPAGLL